MYLEMSLQFQANKNISLEKARHAEDGALRPGPTCGLDPELIQRVQVAAVQAVTLYQSEIWWHGQKS